MRSLQEYFGIDSDPDMPLGGMVHRFDALERAAQYAKVHERIAHPAETG